MHVYLYIYIINIHSSIWTAHTHIYYVNKKHLFWMRLIILTALVYMYVYVCIYIYIYIYIYTYTYILVLSEQLIASKINVYIYSLGCFFHFLKNRYIKNMNNVKYCNLTTILIYFKIFIYYIFQMWFVPEFSAIYDSKAKRQRLFALSLNSDRGYLHWWK